MTAGIRGTVATVNSNEAIGGARVVVKSETPRLTVNLGLRYDYQSITDEHDNFAPRLGFALDVAGDGKTILRGEAFNLTNHTNYIKLNNIYGNNASPLLTFLAPQPGIQNSDPSRQFQFGARLIF